MASIVDHCHRGRDSYGFVMEYHQLPGVSWFISTVSTWTITQDLDLTPRSGKEPRQQAAHIPQPSKMKEYGVHLEFLRKF